MSKTILSAFAALTLFSMIAWVSTRGNKKNLPVVPAGGFAVVELFTSEGCSSCPPADALVARLAAQKNASVYILAYHVDYWNRLGWKDPFSKASFSKRQSEYGASLNLEGVYTPQIVVNGATEFVGSDEDKLTKAVNRNLQVAPTTQVTIEAKQTGNHVDITYSVQAADVKQQLLNFALVQADASVAVKAGENGGRKLHHVNIVRELKTIAAESSGKISFEIPETISGSGLQVIAFTQDNKNLHISGAARQSL